MINIELKDAGVKRMLGHLQKRWQKNKPVFKSIGEYMVRQRANIFRREETPDGKPWKRLKGVYPPGKKILTMDHHLRRTVYRAGNDRVLVSPDVVSRDYAAVHQFGSRPGSRQNIPKREHLGFSDKDVKEFGEIINEYIMRGAK